MTKQSQSPSNKNFNNSNNLFNSTNTTTVTNGMNQSKPTKPIAQPTAFDLLSPQETLPHQQPVQQQKSVQQTPNLLDILNTPTQSTQPNQQQPQQKQSKGILFDFEQDSDEEDEKTETTTMPIQQDPIIETTEIITQNLPITETNQQIIQENESMEITEKLTFDEEYNDEDDINEEDSNYFDELMKESPHFEGDYSVYTGSSINHWKKCIAILSSVDLLITDNSSNDGDMFLLDEITYFDIKNVQPQQNDMYLIECNDKKIMLKIPNGNEFFNELANKMNE